MAGFDRMMDEWLSNQIAQEKNPRRRELLDKGLGHGTVEFLRTTAPTQEISKQGDLRICA